MALSWRRARRKIRRQACFLRPRPTRSTMALKEWFFLQKWIKFHQNPKFCNKKLGFARHSGGDQRAASRGLAALGRRRTPALLVPDPRWAEQRHRPRWTDKSNSCIRGSLPVRCANGQTTSANGKCATDPTPPIHILPITYPTHLTYPTHYSPTHPYPTQYISYPSHILPITYPTHYIIFYPLHNILPIT